MTAGNASGINDGAGAVVIMTADKAKELGITPIAAIKAYGWGGVDPSVMGLGPIEATKSAMAKCGLTVDAFDVIEATRPSPPRRWPS